MVFWDIRDGLGQVDDAAYHIYGQVKQKVEELVREVGYSAIKYSARRRERYRRMKMSDEAFSWRTQAHRSSGWYLLE